MKYSFFLVFLLAGSSHGLFGPISQIVDNIGNQLGQTAENLWNEVTRHVENVIGDLLNAPQQINYAASTFWESLFSRIFDVMMTGKQLAVNDKLNAIVDLIGRPITVPENPLSEKYKELTARLKSNIHHLYEQLFLMQKDALADLEKGEHNFDERIRAFYDKMNAIHQEIQGWAEDTKIELAMHAQTMEGDWNNILQQYNQTIDLSMKTIDTMFQQLSQNLMKNFLDVVLSVVPDALNVIQNLKEQGLLSFFFISK